MQPEYQDIMLSFIEETQDNLQTIEVGLLNLETTVTDFDAASQMLRATHSIKGAAGMLDFPSIQYVAHRMEDYFKVLQTHPVQVDQTLKDQLFQGLDALKTLTAELQKNLTLPESVAQNTLQKIEPVFADLNTHLTDLSQPTVSRVKKQSSWSRSPNRSFSLGTIVRAVLRILTRIRHRLSRWLRF